MAEGVQKRKMKGRNMKSSKWEGPQRRRASPLDAEGRGKEETAAKRKEMRERQAPRLGSSLSMRHMCLSQERFRVQGKNIKIVS